MDGRVEISHDLCIDHSQYFRGSPLPYGVGMTPHEALDDALEQCIQSTEYIADHIDTGRTRVAPTPDLVRAAIEHYMNDEPDEPGELAEIEGWDQDFAEVYWHCVLSMQYVED